MIDETREKSAQKNQAQTSDRYSLTEITENLSVEELATPRPPAQNIVDEVQEDVKAILSSAMRGGKEPRLEDESSFYSNGLDGIDQSVISNR